MNKKLWEASKQLKNNSNLFKFEKFISNKYNKNFSKDFEKIHKWSVSNSIIFGIVFGILPVLKELKIIKSLKNHQSFIRIFFYQNQN
jgi:hypothetical protein